MPDLDADPQERDAGSHSRCLPLLLLAGWLFQRKRRSTWWPFVWGFIFFALFTFFVELVPYLPSYGGYVRNLAGVVVTVLVGRQAILALNRYLERPDLDFCPHCGIALHDRCGRCAVRKRAFAQFCHACGAPAGATVEPGPAPPPLPPAG